MIQEIIVGVIGIAVAIIVIRKIYVFFNSKKTQGGSCGCSNCGCNTIRKAK